MKKSKVQSSYLINQPIKIWLILALLISWFPFILNLPVTLHVFLFAIIAVQSYVFYKGTQLSSIIRFSFIFTILALSGLFSLLHYSVQGVISFSLLAVFFKVLEIKRKKDIYVMLMSLLFVNSTATILNQSLFYSLWLIFNMMVLLSVFVAVEHQNAFKIHKILLFTAKQMLICVPVMLIVFLMFPRINSFWSMPGMSDQATTGLSNFLNPGAIADLAQSNEPAFRVTFKDENANVLSNLQQPNQKDLYWRAMTLDYFDGNTWSQIDETSKSSWNVSNQIQSDSQYYQIIMQPSFQKWMMILDAPVTPISNSTLRNDQTVIANTEFEKVDKYDVVSSKLLFQSININDEQKERLTDFKNTLNPKTLALSQSLMPQSKSKEEYIQSILDYFATQQFYYTLNPGKLNSSNQIDEFLFDSKEGFCSHYASAFTVLARMQNIPSRIVAGYLGGEYNELGGFWQVNQKQAHAWVEVYINDSWMRIDPTSAVALTRIEQGMDSMFEPSSFVDQFRRSSWISALQKRVDAMNYAWQNKVLNYSANNQSSIVSNVGRWWNNNFKAVLLTLVILSVIVFVIWSLRKPIANLFLPTHVKWVKKLDKKLGINEPNQTMEVKLELFIQKFPNKQPQAQLFLKQYLNWRFARQSNIHFKDIKKSFNHLIAS